MDILVDVDLEVLAGQDHTAVIHESHVVALCVLHLGLQGRGEEAFLGVNGQVEVVVVVGHSDLSLGVDPDSDGIVGDSLPTDLSQVVAVVVEDLDAVRSVVTDKDLQPVVDHDSVGEVKVLRAAELLEKVSVVVEDDNSHDLALHHDDTPHVVHADAARVLKNVGAKLSDELPILGVDLNLKTRDSLKSILFK